MVLLQEYVHDASGQLFIQKGRAICGASPNQAAHLQYANIVGCQGGRSWTQMMIADPALKSRIELGETW